MPLSFGLYSVLVIALHTSVQGLVLCWVTLVICSCLVLLFNYNLAPVTKLGILSSLMDMLLDSVKATGKGGDVMLQVSI